MNKNETVDLINKEREQFKEPSHGLATFLIVVCVVLALISIVFNANPVFYVAFLFFAFSEVCIMSADDWLSYCDFEENRKKILKEIYSEELRADD